MTKTNGTPADYPLVEARRIKKYFPIETSFLAKLLTGRKDQTVKAVDGVNLKIWEGETRRAGRGERVWENHLGPGDHPALSSPQKASFSTTTSS